MHIIYIWSYWRTLRLLNEMSGYYPTQERQSRQLGIANSCSSSDAIMLADSHSGRHIVLGGLSDFGNS